MQILPLTVTFYAFSGFETTVGLPPISSSHSIPLTVPLAVANLRRSLFDVALGHVGSIIREEMKPLSYDMIQQAFI